MPLNSINELGGIFMRAAESIQAQKTNIASLDNLTKFVNTNENTRSKHRDTRFSRRREAHNRAYKEYASTKNKLINQGKHQEADALKFPRTLNCGHKLKENTQFVDVRRNTETGHAHYTGTQYCGAVWACPVCSSIIRNAYAKDVTQAVDIWQSKGNGLYMVTVTLRHWLGDDLKTNLEVLTTSWREVVNSRRWKLYKQDHGIEGYIRSLELTYSDANGWHPHFHFLFLVEGKATEYGEAALQDVLLPLWQKYVVKNGGRLPNGNGLDVRAVDEKGRAVAQYVSKIVDGSNISLELARGDLKENDELQSITPFQLLDIDTPKSRALWSNYLAATKGKRSIMFSRGLRDRLGMKSEKTDAEIIEEMTNIGELVCSFESQVYESMLYRDKNLLGDVLSLIERGDYGGVAELLQCRIKLQERRDILTGEVCLIHCFCLTGV